MSPAKKSQLPPAALRLLARLAAPTAGRPSGSVVDTDAATALIAADLATRLSDGRLTPTAAGHAHLRRGRLARENTDIDPYIGQHLALGRAAIATPTGKSTVRTDESESPLAWLARRKDKNGRAMIAPDQLQAGERLRSDFTRGQLMPRITSNWTAAVAQDGRSGDRGAAQMTDAVVAARQRLQRALATAGPEFAGLLLDVCCFLKGLEDVERERGWPPRSAKVVLQLGLDRLARHYGFAAAAHGRARAPVRIWLASDAAFVVD